MYNLIKTKSPLNRKIACWTLQYLYAVLVCCARDEIPKSKTPANIWTAIIFRVRCFQSRKLSFHELGTELIMETGFSVWKQRPRKVTAVRISLMFRFLVIFPANRHALTSVRSTCFCVIWGCISSSSSSSASSGFRTSLLFPGPRCARGTSFFHNLLSEF